MRVTQGLVADLTVNTDFAQVEADEQQINLTRFNLFFPEKRDFFLENQGTFSFGGVPINSAGGNFAGGFIGSSNAAPIMFYSRRIGLHRGSRRCRSTSAGGSPAAPASTASASSTFRPATRRRSSAHPRPTSASFASSATCSGAAASGCCSPTGPSPRSAPAPIARMASTARSRSSRTCRSTRIGRGPTQMD